MGPYSHRRLGLAIAVLGPLYGAACQPSGARFSPETGVLTIVGTVGDDAFVVGRTDTGEIVVNGGLVPILGGVPTVTNTVSIELRGLGGDDHLALDESGGPLPAARLFGGPGADVLIGGSGDDRLEGDAGDDLLEPGPGADVVLGGDDADAIVWRSGDGLDALDGGPGVDSLRVIGVDGADDDLLMAAGRNALLEVHDRVAGVALVSTAVELLSIETGGGDDAIAFADLGEPRPVSRVGIDAGDGNDHVDAALVVDVPLVVRAGRGDDFVQTGASDDEVHGGDGADVLLLGPGDDTAVWSPGDDDDLVEGEGGYDTLVFHGSNAAETLDVSADGDRVRLSRNVANVTMDLGGVEALALRTLGGSDVVAVNDAAGTDLVAVQVDLAATSGSGDEAPDTVIVNGTDGEDVVVVLGDVSGVAVLGLAAQVDVTGAESAQDRLVVRTLAGNDVVDATGLAASGLQLTADGGADDDVLLGGDGNDVLLGGPGDDVLMGGPGLDVLDGGPGDDIEIQ